MNDHENLAGRIGIYARISKEERQGRGSPGGAVDEESNGGSTTSQIYRCRQHLAVHFPADVVSTAVVYCDEGYSGSTTDRPDFQRLMKDIRRRRIRIVVFSELSRMSRSVRDFLDLVDEFSRCGVEFVSLREKFDTTSPQGRLIITILAALNEFEREQTALRTELNMRARADQGYWTGGTLPLGYEIDPERRGHLRAVEDDARVVRTVFDVYLETGSVPKTVARLRELGCERPAWTSTRGEHHRAQPIEWDAVRGILCNPSYIGLREVNRKHKQLSEEEARALAPDERYHTVKAMWPAIVEQQSFDRAQDLLAETDRRNGNIQAPRKHDFTLSGLVHCADCGTALEGASAKNHTYFYYRHPRGAGTPTCPKKAWAAPDVEDLVVAKLSRLAEDEDMLGLIIAEANARLSRDAPVREGELTAARGKVARLQADVQSLIEKLQSASNVPESFWDAARAKEEQLKAARSDVTRLEVELSELKSKRLHAATYREALRQFQRLFEALTPFDRSRLLAYLVERIELHADGARMWLLGENPELNVEAEDGNHPDSQYCPGSQWLRL